MLKRLLTLTEAGMIAYWIFATLVVTGLFDVDPALMYSDYRDPVVVAWNWSFLPLDLSFAILGLAARYRVRDNRRRELLATISLTLMFCAGLMAVSFWAIRVSFDPFWWLINLWLMGLAGWALLKLYREQASDSLSRIKDPKDKS